MKRIELFAPMGAGKSFLFNALMNKKSIYGFVNARDEFYNILLNQIKKKSTLHYYLLKIVYYSPLKTRVFSNYDFYQYLKNDEVDVNSFLEYIFSNLVSNDNNGKTLIRINALLKDLSDVTVLNSYSKKNLLLHEESLLQRGLGFTAGNSLKNSLDYFDNVKLPNAVIFIDTPLDIIKARVFQRENSKISFFVKRAHSENEIIKCFNSYQRICSIIEEKGIKTLRIDGSDPLKKNLEIIFNWIKTI
jgi:hypothetical protein